MISRHLGQVTSAPCILRASRLSSGRSRMNTPRVTAGGGGNHIALGYCTPGQRAVRGRHSRIVSARPSLHGRVSPEISIRLVGSLARECMDSAAADSGRRYGRRRRLLSVLLDEETVLADQVLTFAQYVEWLNAVLRDNGHAADWEMPADTPTPCFHPEGRVSLEAPPQGFCYFPEDRQSVRP